MMPRLNGVKAIERIKGFVEHQLNNVPDCTLQYPQVIFLTSYKTSMFDKHVESLNVSTVLEKPLQLQ
jgi:CheY-like chemotaxis protein